LAAARDERIAACHAIHDGCGEPCGDIWIEQCDAAHRILAEHGPLSALDYLVGEKLMTYVATAEDHPEFARELPKFVAAVRELFGIEAIGTYVARMETRYREGQQAACDAGGGDDDAALIDGPEDWAKEAARLARIKGLLTTERLGTA
jgi:hypothetical protein